MPYYLHAIGADVTSGVSYDTKALALADRQDGQTVTFIASEEERETWRSREQARFYSGVYLQIPWYDTTEYYNHSLSRHYAHISLKSPGKIAYTPDDSYGIADRQLTVKPGKYLTEFIPGITTAQIDDYCSRISALTEPLKLARTTADVVSAYTSGPLNDDRKHSPTSCMSYPANSDHYYTNGIHPVSVYGDSDLAIAYLGTLGVKVTARAVVWPDKQRYSRVYGDTTLTQVLKDAGYREGSMIGAIVRRIECRRGVVMPYVDGCDHATYDRNGLMLSHDGEYGTCSVSGVGEDTEEQAVFMCSRDGCDNERDEDESYCRSCDRERWHCVGCSEDYFDDDCQNRLGDDSFCDNCMPCCEECQICSNEWYTRNNRRYDLDGDLTLSRDELRDLRARGLSDLCEDCAESHVVCPHCDGYSENDTEDEICSECEEPMRDLVTAEVLEGLDVERMAI